MPAIGTMLATVRNGVRYNDRIYMGRLGEFFALSYKDGEHRIGVVTKDYFSNSWYDETNLIGPVEALMELRAGKIVSIHNKVTKEKFGVYWYSPEGILMFSPVGGNTMVSNSGITDGYLYSVCK